MLFVDLVSQEVANVGLEVVEGAGERSEIGFGEPVEYALAFGEGLRAQVFTKRSPFFCERQYSAAAVVGVRLALDEVRANEAVDEATYVGGVFEIGVAQLDLANRTRSPSAR